MRFGIAALVTLLTGCTQYAAHHVPQQATHTLCAGMDMVGEVAERTTAAALSDRGVLSGNYTGAAALFTVCGSGNVALIPGNETAWSEVLASRGHGLNVRCQDAFDYEFLGGLPAPPCIVQEATYCK